MIAQGGTSLRNSVVQIGLRQARQNQYREGLLSTARVVNVAKIVEIEQIRQRSAMLHFIERPQRCHRNRWFHMIEKGAGAARRVMSCRIENAVRRRCQVVQRFCPELRFRMGSGEQPRIGSNPRQPAGREDIDQRQRTQADNAAKVALLQLTRREVAASKLLPESFHERTWNIAADVQDTKAPVRGIESARRASAEVKRPLPCPMQTIKRLNLFNAYRMPRSQVCRRVWVISRKCWSGCAHAAPCSPNCSAATRTESTSPALSAASGERSASLEFGLTKKVNCIQGS